MKAFGLFATIFLGMASVGQAQDIVQTAIAAGFDKLVAAVIRSGLTSFLQNEDDLTVFAPTNEAFEALPEEVLDFLFSPEGTAPLKDILLYHVLAAPVFSTDLSDGDTATTLNGADITVTINDDGIFINESQVIVADIEASNGVIHVIDRKCLTFRWLVCLRLLAGCLPFSSDRECCCMYTVQESANTVVRFQPQRF